MYIYYTSLKKYMKTHNTSSNLSKISPHKKNDFTTSFHIQQPFQFDPTNQPTQQRWHPKTHQGTRNRAHRAGAVEISSDPNLPSLEGHLPGLRWCRDAWLATRNPKGISNHRNHRAWDGGCKPLVNYMGLSTRYMESPTTWWVEFAGFLVARKSSMRNWTLLKSNEVNTPTWVSSHVFFCFFWSRRGYQSSDGPSFFWEYPADSFSWMEMVNHFPGSKLGGFQMISM